MLAFVTSMRHPVNADDYSHNEELLNETLNSISQQSSEDYVVIIVGNERPSFELPARTRFVEVDFPPPERAIGPHADRSGFVRDKGSKIGIGLIAAQAYSPDWVMIFDADDFIHRDLTRFVERHPDSAGWIIDEGWIYSHSRNGYRKQSEFNRTCGTSYIIPFSAYDVPDNLTVEASQDEVVEAYGEVLPNILGAHRNARAWHSARGLQLRNLPFRGAVYHVDTGENHSRKGLPGLIRPWSKSLEYDFGIRSNQAPMRTLFSCLGPMVVVRIFVDLARRAMRRLHRRREAS